MDRTLNSNIGDYDLSDDHTRFEMIETLKNAAYISLITPLGSGWADQRIGSLLYTLVREKA